MPIDKNEFYKELFEKYTFDSEKVKCNAKRLGKRRQVTPIYKAAGVAGVAAVAIVAGCVLFSSFSGEIPVEIVPSTNPEVAIARLRAAEDNFMTNNFAATDMVEMFVSFSEPITVNSAYRTFSSVNDLGEIECLIFYCADGTVIYREGSSQLSSDTLVSGAKISAPAEYFTELKEKTPIFLVELKTDDMSDDEFVPINKADAQAVETSTVATEPTLPSEIVLPSETTTVQTEPPVASETTSATTESDVEQTTEAQTDTQATEQSTEQTTVAPEINELILPIDATEAYFINNTELLVLTPTSVELYYLDGLNCTSDKIYLNNPKINWINAECTSMFITGCDGATRNRLIFINGATPGFTDLSSVAGNDEITSVTYSEKENTIIFKLTGENNSRLIVSERNGESLENKVAVTTDSPVAALAYSDGVLYYSETDVAADTVSFNKTVLATGETTRLSSYSGKVKFTKSYSNDSVAITTTNAEGVSETSVFYADTQEFVAVTVNGSIRFSHLNSRIFSDDSASYCITAQGQVEISSDQAQAYTSYPIGSGAYGCEIKDGGISVIKK